MFEQPFDDPRRAFQWRDGERLVCFGRGALSDAPALLGDGYTLLSTARARAGAPALTGAAAVLLDVGPGRVDELAAGLRGQTRGELLVALGGGRVIDTAKALAAADPPLRVAAVPTTLSAAEMTGVHRHATGVSPQTPRVRPVIVINDPDLSASAPEPELAASAANALAHAVEGSLTTLQSPVPTLAAVAAAGLIARAFTDVNAEPDREALALAALLSGYAIDASGYGLHHVLAQTLVRFGGVGHGPANAVLLAHTISALASRAPAPVRRLAAAMGREPVELARSLATRAQAQRIRDLGVQPDDLDRCAREAAGRSELHLTPPPADEAELRSIYQAAW